MTQEDTTQQTEHDHETERLILLGTLKLRTGDAFSDFCEVLSYFPDTAELFIKTQQHARSVSVNKLAIHYTVEHKKDGHGVDKTTLYKKGEVEHLGVRGFTGEDLIKIIDEVNHSRGKGWKSEFVYSPGETANRILVIAKKPLEQCNAWELMEKKVLEVMEVTTEELEAIAKLIVSSRELRELKVAESRAEWASTQRLLANIRRRNK